MKKFLGIILYLSGICYCTLAKNLGYDYLPTLMDGGHQYKIVFCPSLSVDFDSARYAACVTYNQNVGHQMGRKSSFEYRMDNGVLYLDKLMYLNSSFSAFDVDLTDCLFPNGEENRPLVYTGLIISPQSKEKEGPYKVFEFENGKKIKETVYEWGEFEAIMDENREIRRALLRQNWLNW